MIHCALTLKVSLTRWDAGLIPVSIKKTFKTLMRRNGKTVCNRKIFLRPLLDEEKHRCFLGAHVSEGKIRSDVVIKSLMKCGISNTMEGTGDDILFDQNTGSNDKMSNFFTSNVGFI